MDTPIHAAENVDQETLLPRIVAAAAGVLIIVVVAVVVALSGLWNPPPTAMKAPTPPTQTAMH